MQDELLTDALLRKFLLGEVNDDERQRIESLFITDPVVRERLLVVEEDLIDDYLEDSLSAAEKDSFLLHYADTPAQQRKLRISKSVKDWAAMNAASIDEASTPIPVWDRLFARLRLQPVLAIPVATAAIIAVVVLGIWLNGKLEERNRRLALEQELHRLNTPASLNEIPPQMISMTLPPVSVRSGDAQKELTPSSEIIELRFLWIRNDHYPSYRAVIRRFNDQESLTVSDLHEENGGVIRMRLQSRMLTRGLYQIEVNGIAADGTAGPAEEYRFTAGE